MHFTPVIEGLAAEYVRRAIGAIEGEATPPVRFKPALAVYLPTVHTSGLLSMSAVATSKCSAETLSKDATPPSPLLHDAWRKSKRSF